MIPSGPECYLSGNLQIDYWDCLDEPLSLTNIGLPMTLLVVPVCITYEPGISGEDFHPCSTRISCPLFDDVVTAKGIPHKWYGSAMAVTNKYALGISNLNLEMDNIGPTASGRGGKHTKFLRSNGRTSFAGWI